MGGPQRPAFAYGGSGISRRTRLAGGSGSTAGVPMAGDVDLPGWRRSRLVMRRSCSASAASAVRPPRVSTGASHTIVARAARWAGLRYVAAR